MAKRILLLGATGSIGESTDRVVRGLLGELRIVALGANSQWQRMLELTRIHEPEVVAMTSPEAAEKLRNALRREKIPQPRVYDGADGLVAMVRETPGDMVVAAVSGAAGLPANLAALETGKDLALANKESMVLSGRILTETARRHGRRILPVDSEHSAIFQALQAGRRQEVRALILTASGGPFRCATRQELESVTREQALRHPTWDMGAKITIDSATLMNKALELIEARWLFDMPADQLEVVIHPQSIVHSLVEYRDGSTVCQLGRPDMRVPIQYALTYPERRPLAIGRLDLASIGDLSFAAPDPVRFPSLRLAYEVLRGPETAAAVFNAANEVAVSAFLADEIRFLDIVSVVEETLAAHSGTAVSSLSEVLAVDDWARQAARDGVLARGQSRRSVSC